MTKIVSFEELGADPDQNADQIVVYAKEVDGVTQLYGRASDGTIYQLTPVKPTRVWSYPVVNGDVASGVPFLTINGFQTTLGKRYTFIATGSFFGAAATPGDILDLSLFVIQDSGKPAIQITHAISYVPSETDDDASAVLAGQGSLVGDGNTHDYTMYVFWNTPATWTVVTGGGAASWLTIIETDNEQ